MSETVERAVRELPLLTRAHVLEEGDQDPRFWSYFARLALSPDPGRRVDDDMKRAVINELDPGRHGDTVGRWPILRQKVKETVRAIGTQKYVHGSLDGLGAEALQATLSTVPQKAPDNVWSAIGSVISSLGTSAANIYSTKIVTSAQTDIAKTQAGVLAAQQQAAQQMALQQAAQQAAYPPPAAPSTGTSTLMYVLLGLLGVGGLLLFMKGMKR